MAVKSILRKEKPVVIAVSTNNALSRQRGKHWKTIQ